MMQEFWRAFFQKGETMSQVDGLYSIMSLASNIEDQCQLVAHARIIESLKAEIPTEEAERNRRLQRALEESFVSFIKAKGSFPKSELVAKKKRGELMFEGVAEILHELCHYDESTHQFICRPSASQSVHLKVLPSEHIAITHKFSRFVQLGITYSKELPPLTPTAQKLLSVLFAPPEFAKGLKQSSQGFSAKSTESSRAMRKMRKCNIGYIYLFYFIFSSKVSHNPELKEFIEQLRQSEDLRKPYESDANLLAIAELLSLPQEPLENAKIA